MVKKNVRKWKRSGSERCPVCDVEAPLVEHHIHGREVPRWRQDWNVLWCCATCHDLIHQFQVIVEGWFKIDGVRTLVWRKKGEEPKLGDGAVPPNYSKK